MTDYRSLVPPVKAGQKVPVWDADGQCIIYLDVTEPREGRQVGWQVDERRYILNSQAFTDRGRVAKAANEAKAARRTGIQLAFILVIFLIGLFASSWIDSPGPFIAGSVWAGIMLIYMYLARTNPKAAWVFMGATAAVAVGLSVLNGRSERKLRDSGDWYKG